LSELRVVNFDGADEPDDDSHIIERQRQLHRQFGGRGGNAADGAGLALSAAVQEQMRAADLELEARRARLQAAGVELRACGICLDDVPASEFRNDGFNAACGHAFCEACMREHYRVKIMDADIADLRCVDPRCDRRVTDAEVYAAIGGEASGPLADKFRKFKRNAEVAANPNARWCIKSGCDTFMIGSEARPHLTCPTCNTGVCFSCNGAWHEGQRCDEVIDAQYAQWARGRDIQQCPQCRVRIEKDHGCVWHFSECLFLLPVAEFVNTD
jgi:hypothetical protein